LENDLTEEALVDAITKIRNCKPKLEPRRLFVSDEGIARQARNYKNGIITEADMRAADVPQDLIDEVKRIAKEI